MIRSASDSLTTKPEKTECVQGSRDLEPVLAANRLTLGMLSSFRAKPAPSFDHPSFLYEKW